MGNGLWAVACNATPPAFGVQIGGVMLWSDPASLILAETRNRRGECVTGIGSADTWYPVLGDVFMQQLVVVFDISDKMELRFAKRA